jgi:hypothetical protein
MIDFAERRYPLTGFGDDTNASIKFMLIRYPNRDDEHAWTGGEADITFHRPRNSSDEIQQYHGRLALTFTTRLWFRDMDALEAMSGVRGRAATLRYAWGITLRAGGEKATLADGRSYLVLPNTTLVSLTGIQTPRGRLPEATATFRRAVGASDYYGFAVYAEDI